MIEPIKVHSWKRKKGEPGNLGKNPERKNTSGKRFSNCLKSAESFRKILKISHKHPGN